MQSFNAAIIWIARFAIIALFMFMGLKYNRAKKLDNTIKFHFNLRSWIEIIIVVGLDLFFIAYPVTQSSEPILLIAGVVGLTLTYMHTRRYIAIGKKVIFIMEASFHIRDISRVKYEKGKMTFLIKNVPFHLRFPLIDMDYLEERVSGKRKIKN